MKNTRIVILYYKLSFLILFLLLKSALLLATEDVIYNLKFKQLSAPYFLPTNEVQKCIKIKMDLSGSLLVMDFASIMAMRPLFINPIFTLRIY